jgi:uncharacterized membrane protein YeaQ/YmgE (transglycosylase-associated protein family)
MLAFVVAGVILGVLARVLRRGPEHAPLPLTLAVGLVGAVVGGVGMNLLLRDDWVYLNAFSFASACIVGIVLLGLLEGRVGRAQASGRG